MCQVLCKALRQYQSTKHSPCPHGPNRFWEPYTNIEGITLLYKKAIMTFPQSTFLLASKEKEEK